MIQREGPVSYIRDTKHIKIFSPVIVVALTALDNCYACGFFQVFFHHSSDVYVRLELDCCRCNKITKKSIFFIIPDQMLM